MTTNPDTRLASSFSVIPAMVTRNDDTFGRVKVRFPWMGDQDESDWLGVATPGAGADRGLFVIPAVDDQVLVAFSFGQIDKAYVIGALWSTADKPPSAGDPNRQTWKSRSGHVIELDDTGGAERISIIDRAGTSKITIDTANKAITIESAGDLTIKAAGNLTLQSGKDVAINGNHVSLAATGKLAGKANSIALDGPAGVKINDGALEVV